MGSRRATNVDDKGLAAVLDVLSICLLQQYVRYVGSNADGRVDAADRSFFIRNILRTDAGDSKAGGYVAAAIATRAYLGATSAAIRNGPLVRQIEPSDLLKKVANYLDNWWQPTNLNARPLNVTSRYITSGG